MVEQILAPTLRKGDIVFMDNLRTHKPGGRSGRRQGALFAGLLADLNPIEMAFSS